MITKTWFYKDKNNPIPILLLDIKNYNSIILITYREVLADGQLDYIKSEMISEGDLGHNTNLFPEIKTKYCKKCGEVE